MNDKVILQLTKLNEQLNFIEIEIDSQIKKCENAIDIILKSIEAIKKIISKSTFKTDSEEIIFFKEIKPQFTSKLIFYNMVYKIEMKKPNGGNRILKKYYHNELLKLKAFFDNELEFYQYYRSGSTYLDYKYFQRGKFDIKLALDSYYFEADTTFSTSHDFKVARILANEIRFKVMGDITNLPAGTKKLIADLEAETKSNRGLKLTFAFGYGGRSELSCAINRFMKDHPGKEVTPEDIEKYLMVPDLGDVDLLIRSGGDHRISNFMLWQIAYAELQFLDVLWPDFTKDTFFQCILDYQNKERRFGKTGEQIKIQ